MLQIHEVARLAEALAGVRRSTADGLAQWRYHGRLVARQLDDAHVVIRADFDYRDSLLRQFPETFSVPARYTKHMMIVADLANGDPGAIEDALEAAWQLQRSADRPCHGRRRRTLAPWTGRLGWLEGTPEPTRHARSASAISSALPV